MNASSGLIILGLLILWLVKMRWDESRQRYLSMPPEERAAHQRNLQRASLDRQHGAVSPQVICPHCHSRGMVRTKAIKKKAGISGGKATAALLTVGVSLLATGLSRKEALTQAHCENCNSIWAF